MIREKEGVYTLVYDAENRLVRVDAALNATATPTATMTSTATITSTPTVTATGGTPTETATQAVTATATLETTSMGASTATSVAATDVPTTASTVEPTATLTPEAPTATATPEAPTAEPAKDIPATPVGAVSGGVIMAAYHQQDAATETPVDSTATPEVSDTVEPTATLPAAEGNAASPVAPEAQTDSLMQLDSLTATATATSAFTPTATTVPTEGPAQPLQNATYIYDADGNLVKSVINGRSTYYLGKLYQKQVDATSTTIQKYYTSGSAQIAVRTVKDTNDNLQWLLSDHLGSTSTTANMDGTWNSTIQYSAFGEIRTSSGITPTEYRYTGQLRQPELGLYYYVARWYDPQIGHFVQADTVVQNTGDSIAFDRYGYVNNNPLINNDPSGHFINLAFAATGAVFGAITGAIMAAAPQVIHNIQTNQPLTANIDPVQVAKSAAIGAAVGGIGGLTFGLGLAAGSAIAGAVGISSSSGALATIAGVTTVAFSGAAAGQTSRATQNILEGKKVSSGLFNGKDMALDAALSVITFGLSGSKFKDIVPADTRGLGPFAKGTIPSSNPHGTTMAERDAVQKFGVCHTCGTTDPGGNGRFVADHIPPRGPELTSQCWHCSWTQGGYERQGMTHIYGNHIWSGTWWNTSWMPLWMWTTKRK